MLQANYFDGCSTRVRVVNLSLVGEDLVIAGEDIDVRVPFGQIKVDERLGQAPRRLRLNDGTFCEVRDLDAFDTLLSSLGHRDGRIDRMQRHLQFVLLCCVAFAVLAAVAYKWGLPWAAARGAQHLPPDGGAHAPFAAAWRGFRTLKKQQSQALQCGAIWLPVTVYFQSFNEDRIVGGRLREQGHQ